MIRTIWYYFVLVAAVSNGVRDSVHWWQGDSATGWTWMFAIMLSIDVASRAACRLFPKPKESE
jgi:hypothetical protein